MSAFFVCRNSDTGSMTLTRIFSGLVLLTGSLVVHADQAELIVYAEHQPLATKSLLLDIMQMAKGSFIAVGERGHIVISENGIDWKQAEVVPSRSTLTVITEHDDLIWAAGHDSVILSSGDGGNTWTRQYFDPERQQPIMDLLFTAGGRGIAIGAYGLMLVTTDGGESWQDQEVSEEGWHLNAMLELDDGRLMIAGEAGFSYRSLDGGLSWETLKMPYPGSMFGLLARSNGCIVEFGLRGHVQESCDFGDNWMELGTGTSSTISGAEQSHGDLLFVGNSGLVLEQDQVGNFSSTTHSGGGDLSSVVATESGFLMVGEDGIHKFPETGAERND